MGGGGGKDGGGGSVSQVTATPSPYETQLANMASDIYSSTAPIRNIYLSDWQNFLTPHKTLKTGAVGTQVPIYGDSGGTSNLWKDAQGTVYDTTPVAFGNEYYTLVDGSNRLVTPVASSGGGTSGGITGYKTEYSPSDYVTSQYNPADLPGYTPMYDISRRGLERQYNTAVDQLAANTPRGGALNSAIAKLNLSRAESVGELPSQISSSLISDMLNKSYGAAFNAPSQSITGLSAANQGYTSTQNALINAQMAANAQQSSSKTSGLGMLGMGMGNMVGSALGSMV